MATASTATHVALSSFLIASNLSPDSLKAARFAALLARAQPGGRLCVAHVFPLQLFGPVYPDPWTHGPDKAADATQQLRDWLAEAGVGDIPTTYDLRNGELWLSLERIASEQATDVIVVATHGREGIEKLFRGSAAELIMRSAECPVLVTGPHADAKPVGIRRILLATDFGLGAGHAAPYAVEIAGIMKAELVALNVVEREIVVTEFGVVDFAAEAEESARRELAETLPPGRVFEAVVTSGVACESIVKLALERNIDLIVMGRRRHSPVLAAHTPWTTAHRVIAEAPCPVLTVR